MTSAPEAEAPGRAAVVVACGGVGVRFKGNFRRGDDGNDPGYSGAKQFLEVAGRPVLAHTLDVLERHPRVGAVSLVLPEQLIGKGEALVGGAWPEPGAACFRKVRFIVPGGTSRQESVARGLAALADSGWDGPVLIHDGVRPCTPAIVFDRVIDGVYARGNAVAAIPLRDTVKRAGADGTVRETPDRGDLWQVQTPQGFWIHELTEAYDEGRRRGLLAPDDAALLEAMGREVYLVEGHPMNIKLTYPEDLVVLEALLHGWRKGDNQSPSSGEMTRRGSYIQ